EPRLGIGMQNATKTTKEGLLYQVQMIRMKPCYGFIVDIRLSMSATSGNVGEPEKLLDDQETWSKLNFLPLQGWMTLGGERRTAHFEVVEDVQADPLEREKPGRLLYLATPAVLQGGWQPLVWNMPPPITAAIQRYQPIGGWSMNTHDSGGTSKVMHRCVPAGSVYFFDQPMSMTHPLTDFGREIGYGITYAGEWYE
ncbi:MAG: type III-B CRISPR module-associated Cmr3 family protein, partial [Ktedonobacteraceae bacterium]